MEHAAVPVLGCWPPLIADVGSAGRRGRSGPGPGATRPCEPLPALALAVRATRSDRHERARRDTTDDTASIDLCRRRRRRGAAASSSARHMHVHEPAGAQPSASLPWSTSSIDGHVSGWPGDMIGASAPTGEDRSRTGVVCGHARPPERELPWYPRRGYCGPCASRVTITHDVLPAVVCGRMRVPIVLCTSAVASSCRDPFPLSPSPPRMDRANRGRMPNCQGHVHHTVH